MLHQVTSAGMVIAKRSVEGGTPYNYNLPTWALIVVFLTVLVFVPVFLYIGYALHSVYPTLAMIEDPNSPTYEPLSLSEDADAASATAADKPKMVTSSLRSINSVLFSVGGWRSNFRGFLCALVITIATAVVGGIFSAVPFVPSFVGTLLATLALVQLHTTWVHVVISQPSPLPFWKRLPPFKKTFEATCIPVFVVWFATTLRKWVPLLIAGAVGLPVWQWNKPTEVPAWEPGMGWKSLVVTIVALALYILVVIPAGVVLVRVQASLLPPEEDAVVSFDRSYEGTVEPAIVGGKGYITWKDALKTFPRASWIRLYVLYFKVFLVSIAVYVAFLAILIPEIILMSRKSEQAN